MIGALESPNVRAEYCLKKMEETVHAMEMMDKSLRKSDAGRKLTRRIEYWDRMVLLAALGETNPNLTKWAKENMG